MTPVAARAALVAWADPAAPASPRAPAAPEEPVVSGESATPAPPDTLAARAGDKADTAGPVVDVGVAAAGSAGRPVVAA